MISQIKSALRDLNFFEEDLMFYGGKVRRMLYFQVEFRDFF